MEIVIKVLTILALTLNITNATIELIRKYKNSRRA